MLSSGQSNGVRNNQAGKSKLDEQVDDKVIDERELLRFQAQLCEHAGRFDDMVEMMKQLCEKYNDLTNEERDLLSCAYKNVIGSRRTSWRILNEILLSLSSSSRKPTPEQPTPDQQQQQQDKLDAEATKQTTTAKLTTSNFNELEQPAIVDQQNNKQQQYNYATVKSILNTIEDELRDHCGNVIEILSNRLIPSTAATGESKVFYYKMKGDYLRYLCEISLANVRKEKSNESLLAYKTASDKAMVELPPTHPIRLGLMLNFSVFYYDIIKSPDRSCKLAKQAFDDAIAELDTLSEESYRDSTIIMQLLRDNLNLWESEQNMQTTAID